MSFILLEILSARGADGWDVGEGRSGWCMEKPHTMHRLGGATHASGVSIMNSLLFLLVFLYVKTG